MSHCPSRATNTNASTQANATNANVTSAKNMRADIPSVAQQTLLILGTNSMKTSPIELARPQIFEDALLNLVVQCDDDPCLERERGREKDVAALWDTSKKFSCGLCCLLLNAYNADIGFFIPSPYLPDQADW
eukprot:904875-Pelagomonas_calceolata.AAC.1